jgi:hypothetical protein
VRLAVRFVCSDRINETTKEVMQMDLGYLLLTAVFFVATGLLISGCDTLRGK